MGYTLSRVHDEMKTRDDGAQNRSQLITGAQRVQFSA